MIPRTSTEIAEVNGSLHTGQFSIEMNAEMFRMLSGGVYSDKIGAVVRELACNAHDAHKDAGNPDPIKITLPHEIHPTFIVRDDGIGLSHEDVLSLYTRYGGSTKRTSNAVVGKWGIGSKSPFAYTNAFSVESRFNGERRSYTAYIDANGIPSITYEGCAATDEHNGLTVSVPVMASDIEAFRSKGQAILQWFDPAPAGIEPIVYVARHDGWTMRDKEASNSYVSRGSYARMGSVVYKIEKSKLSAEYGTPNYEEINDLVGLLEMPLVIDFGIGELDITASRESLSYDNDTIAAIRKRLVTIQREILVEYQVQVEAQPTPYMAFKKMREFYKNTSRPLDQLIAKSLTYRGEKLDYTSMVITLGDAINGIQYPGTTLRAYRHADRGRRYRHTPISYPIKFTGTRDVYVGADDDLKVYMVDDTVKNWQRRIEADLGRGSDTTVVLLVKGDPAVVTDVLGPYEIRNLANIEPVPVDRSTSYRASSPAPKLYYYGAGEFERTEDQMHAHDLYVRVFDKCVADDDPAKADFYGYRSSAFLKGRTIYGVPTRYKSDPGGIHLKTFIEKERAEYFEDHPDLARKRWLKRQLEAIPAPLVKLMGLAPDKREFKPFAEILSATWDEFDREVAAHLKLEDAYTPTKSDIDVGERIAKLYARWPLLKWMEDFRYPTDEQYKQALAYIGV